MSSEKHNDIRWIVSGALALLITGMVLVTVASTYSKDAAGTMTALGGMVTMGAAGIFGLYRMQQDAQKSAVEVKTALQVSNEEQAERLAENTQLTERIVERQGVIERRLNGDLDIRIAEAAKQAVVDAMPSIKKAMVEVLEEWSRPGNA